MASRGQERGDFALICLMLSLSRGQKLKLAQLTSQTRLTARLEMSGALDFDLSCFGLDSNGQLSDDRYFVFFNQKNSPQNEVVLGSLDAKTARFELDLTRLPQSVRRLVFVATVDGNGAMNSLKTGRFALQTGATEVAEFAFAGADFGGEKAVMIAEIYFKDEWRIAANGQGFKDGLSAVLKHFGGQEIDAAPAKVIETPPFEKRAKPATFSPPVPQDSAPKQIASQEAISSAPKTVTLKKAQSSFKIDLTKTAAEIVATAQWVDNGDKRSDNDDLDLRAGILWPDGRMSIVTCTSRGSLQQSPFVFHMGDVKKASVTEPGREIIKVNPQISAHHNGGKIAIVFSIYSAIANGPVAIASLKPQITIQYGTQIVKCELDFNENKDAKKKFVYTYVIGMALIDGQHIEVSPGGQVPAPGSEATPWLTWEKSGGVKLSFDGPAVLKGGTKILQGLLNAGNNKRYV